LEIIIYIVLTLLVEPDEEDVERDEILIEEFTGLRMPTGLSDVDIL
jgi:hypothetical protein